MFISLPRSALVNKVYQKNKKIKMLMYDYVCNGRGLYNPPRPEPRLPPQKKQKGI